jgi:hypothetical protein
MKREERHTEGEEMNEEMLNNVQSPADKLQESQPTGSLVPGAENPESQEIKKEVNPNTE